MFDLDFSKIAAQLAYNPDSPMIFASGIFLFLFLGFSLIYGMLHKKATLRILFVVLFSYYFYYKSSGTYFFLLAVVTFSDFFIARGITAANRNWLRRMLMALSLIINLGLLCYFKYTNFLLEVFSPLWNGTFEPLDIFLPVGISFFTFQSMSYTVDVYRKVLQPLDNLLDYAFYVSFFPQLVAGPIVRARDFIPQIRKPLEITPEMFGRGVFLIAIGLLKKAVISDYISINFVERVFASPTQYTGVENLFAVYGYALQIFCDFSGYSDMAIGIALLLGFRFPDNFNAPYKSVTPTEFWRRWHISLSSWLKDYLYISLGGNRKGKFRTYLNLMVTMLLGGLWHGASLNFIVWGGLHGLALVVDKAWRAITGKAKDFSYSGWKKVLATLLTFHFVCFCWIFFRCRDFSLALDMLRQIFTSFQVNTFTQMLAGYTPVFVMIAIGYFGHFLPEAFKKHCEKGFQGIPTIFQALFLVLVIYVVIQVKSSDVLPFIYFQF